MTMEHPTHTGPGSPRPWWRGAAIYQIYPRSFADSNNDGVGDLPGITRHLDHIASLGVDAVWLSPFFTSPMRDFGYDVSDFRDVDPLFGTLADFDALVARAHALNLKVIIDQVYSHTSDQHAWFQESRQDRTNPKADWYVWADAKPDGSPPCNWQSVFGGPAWTWDARRRQYYLHNFLTEQPDLNVHNPVVQDALLDVARFWLDRGVDGFRLDAINFSMHDPAFTDNPVNPDTRAARTRPFDFQLHSKNMSHPDIPKFLERIRGVLDSYDGDRFTVAEVGGPDADREMKAFTAGDTRLNSAYDFSFLYADTLTPALVRKALELWPDEPGLGWPSWAFSNHDAPRCVSRWAKPQDRAAFARMAALLLVTLRGNIFFYQGEELALTQVSIPFEQLQDPEAIANWPLTLGRDGARTPMPWTSGAPNAGFSTVQPWLPVGADHDAMAVDRQQADPHSHLALTRRVLGLRKAHAALAVGDMRFIETGEHVLAFERSHGDETLLCLFNFGPGAWTTPEGANWPVVDSVGEPRSGTQGWTLPPFGGLVLSRPK
ncbi:alpha-glucosidase family protein [Nitrospirillum sp. BR 11164]|uniref:alpha-glucosidase family protein n=1 Tax=Nitrospirillum sp. BR 11164 TaxID=3104324 RepID=UPI002AFFD8D9|nr:alpha-glucosidase family protein [Nitrospirillum sp. BR 11164]MEA1647426.1 alpha-glucosidase family protein [Nitrospirillum sp. BR 11164]